MIWLLVGGFLIAVALIAGLFLVDRKSIDKMDTSDKRKESKLPVKQQNSPEPIEISGDVVQKLGKHIEKADYGFIDRVVDQMEFFPREKQNLIRQGLDQPVVRERYQSGLTDKDYKTRAQSCERLGKIGGEGIAVLLFNAMADKNEEVRLAATAGLKKIKDPSVAEMLVGALKFPNKWLPARIAEVLLSLGQVSVTALQGALQDDDPVIRAYVVELLGEMGPMVPASALFPALRDEHSNVRLQAARVLGKIGLSNSMGLLVELLNDPENKVQIQAVRSIGRISGDEAVKNLEGVLNSNRDSAIQLAALDALRLMGHNGSDALHRVASQGSHHLSERAKEFLKHIDTDNAKKVKISYM